MRPSHHSILLSLTAIFLVLGCTPKSFRIENEGEVLYTPEYAKKFTLYSLKNRSSSIARIQDPWQGAEGIVQDYFISRNGEIPPEGFEGILLKANPHRIICLSSSYIAMVDALGKIDRIVGISGRDYVSNEYVQANPDKVAEIGFEIDFEQLLTLHPDLILLYGISGSQSTLTHKLDELHIPYLYMGEYLEEHPLGKAEWGILVGEILDDRGEAERLFSQTRERYNWLKESLTNISYTPTVMVNLPWNDSWLLPPRGSYLSTLIQDAGGVLAFEAQEGSTPSTIGQEEALSLLAKADYWIHIGQATKWDDIPEWIRKNAPRIKAYTNHKIYNNNLRVTKGGGSDFFESAVIHPDLVLEDLINLLHPRQTSYRYTYYRPIL